MSPEKIVVASIRLIAVLQSYVDNMKVFFMSTKSSLTDDHRLSVPNWRWGLTNSKRESFLPKRC